MARPTVFMYSGQGSQYFHMTRELYERNPRYRLWLEHCEDIASPLLGRSLLDAIFDPRKEKGDPFDSLPASSAALLSVEYALTRVVQELGYDSDILVGYSLGEITAAVVAEALSLEDGMSFVVEFARLLEERTPRSGMLAVVGASELLLTNESLFAGCWVTARNFDGNFVVSGRAADIDALERALESRQVLHQRLPVHYGVHTELIDAVEEQGRRLIGVLPLAPPQIPIISCATTERVDAVSADGIWAAMRRPVEFARTIERMTATSAATFVDLGPSATLGTFVKYLVAPGGGSAQTATINRFGNDVKSMDDFRSFMASR